VVRRLAALSDIVVENYKAGALARYGLGYEALKAVNPRLIYASITGYGQSGPRRDAAAYDFAIQAMGGLMSVTGERDGMPGGGPQKVGVPIVDLMTGMYATVGVLAGLARRAETGEGDLHRRRHARRAGGVSGEPGHELARLGQHPEARRQSPSQHPAPGRVSLR
jgi:crotonobetainyl-CoA:carnitine CoA-transferase CaiB-like acyl-CoA transferase